VMSTSPRRQPLNPKRRSFKIVACSVSVLVLYRQDEHNAPSAGAIGQLMFGA
jgi:hypothetical protein